jgi:hypothetical protein
MASDDIKWTATSADGETFNLSFHGLTRGDAFKMLSTMHDIQQESGRTCTTIFDWTTLALSREVIESQLAKEPNENGNGNGGNHGLHPLLKSDIENSGRVSAQYRDNMTRLGR